MPWLPGCNELGTPSPPATAEENLNARFRAYASKSARLRLCASQSCACAARVKKGAAGAPPQEIRQQVNLSEKRLPSNEKRLPPASLGEVERNDQALQDPREV